MQNNQKTTWREKIQSGGKKIKNKGCVWVQLSMLLNMLAPYLF